MFRASEFRSKEALKSLPDKAGYYKWWATREDFNRLLNTLGITYDNIADKIEQKDGLYCIYLGIAANEPIRKRIDWHINDPHTEARVKSGFLSTFRQSLSSLLAHDQYDKAVTDDFISKLCFEYFTIDFPVKSQEVVDELHRIEKQMLEEHLYILNIQDNHYPDATDISKLLKAIRKSSK